MPAGKRPVQPAEPKAAAVKGFKPAWIKEAVEAHTEAETPWGRMRKRDSVADPEEAKKRHSRIENDDDDDEAGGFAIPQLRKVSVTEKQAENGDAAAAAKERDTTFTKPQLKSVKNKEKEPKAAEKDENKKLILPKLNSVKVEKMKELPPPPKKDTPDYRQVLKKTPTKDRFDEEKKKSSIPMAPPMPPPAPAMPKGFDANLSDKQQKQLKKLKSRPKTRPDWSAVLKGIEVGPKLKHVETNDRSKPILQKAVRTKGQFIYESEKDNAHNVLLKEIQHGVKLNRVKTNDRSKPNLEGLRKIRRQMTIEEQIQKCVSMASVPNASCANLASLASMGSFANLPPDDMLNMSMTNINNMTIPPDEDDDTDDIDKLRDDLQSTKQLLTAEIKAKENQNRENKRLLARIQNLEKELEIEKGIAKSEKEAEKKREPDEKLIITLKAEAAEARKYSEALEKKFTTTCKDLDKTKLELEEMERRNSELEKKLQEFLCKRFSVSDRRESQIPEDDADNNGSESDSESEEEESEEKKAKREAKEVKMLANKLRGFKNKEDNANKERTALKEIMKKHQLAIKEEKKKYKQLQKEVDKMAALMKESDSEDEDDEPEDEPEEDDDTETETSDSETSESDDSESERSQSEPEDAPVEKKKENLVARMRRHENRLAALKKTNLFLKTNVERLQDDFNEQKEKTATLKADLDSVLAELG